MIEDDQPFPWKTVGIIAAIFGTMMGVIILIITVAIQSSKTITDARSHAAGLSPTIAYITPPPSTNFGLLTQQPRYIKMIDSQTTNISYAYAPTIIKENGTYYAFFCSIGGTPETRYAWDYIRMATSTDGLTWTPPVIKVRAVNTITPLDSLPPGNTKTVNASACDPSIVRYKGPGDQQEYYYMYYSSVWEDHREQLESRTVSSGGSVILVARSATIDGSYAKYTDDGQWVEDPGVMPGTDKPTVPANPKIIIQPLHYPSTSYGAGQPTVVVYNGKLRLWYADTSIDPAAQPQIFMLDSDDPVNWRPSATAVVPDLYKKNSNDIKFDPVGNLFYTLAVEGYPYTYLTYSTSQDGTHWQPFTTVIPQSQFPNNASNTGICANALGHLTPNEPVFFAFGVGPYIPSFVMPPVPAPAENMQINLLGISLPYGLFIGSPTSPTIEPGTINIQVKNNLPHQIQIIRGTVYKMVNKAQTQVQVIYPNQPIESSSQFKVKFSQVCITGETDFKVDITYKDMSSNDAVPKTLTLTPISCNTLQPLEISSP